mmetsp:Transcript_20552/g.29710  ORF Transcript_20552/g.29710 Transcript_20552/m.29710 type:complete len:99 (-) Transcript_20552:18-314(-)|eukprot:CAMPEP_0202468924 /NCGR_PEP_ID=MMETSP1360-20130828/76925_1 /ASSEMBLY_ACC=CAM_ASM_000848 /TAXON_ID=515479 /ORGANISM="Licmophora paradoxa, Strain CCMP2313" /LENGTH=98 /DNA_ID=CAMNT_0049094069 /DNA_START=182 /DNA_END=478 /DNA_ORIENTATION=-
MVTGDKNSRIFRQGASRSGLKDDMYLKRANPISDEGRDDGDCPEIKRHRQGRGLSRDSEMEERDSSTMKCERRQDGEQPRDGASSSRRPPQTQKGRRR